MNSGSQTPEFNSHCQTLDTGITSSGDTTEDDPISMMGGRSDSLKTDATTRRRSISFREPVLNEGASAATVPPFNAAGIVGSRAQKRLCLCPSPFPTPNGSEADGALSPSATPSPGSSTTKFSEDGIVAQEVPRNQSYGGHVSALHATMRGSILEEGRQVAEPCGETAQWADAEEPSGRPLLVGIDITEYERYKRGRTYPFIGFERGQPTITKGLDRTAFSLPAAPKGWDVHIHPEGARYFCNTDKRIPVLTENWIYDKDVLEEVTGSIENIFERLGQHSPHWDHQIAISPLASTPECSETLTENGSITTTDTVGEQPDYPQHHSPVVLVLEKRLSGNIGYYFVDHISRRLFWLEDYDYSFPVGEVHVKHTPSHIGLEMKSQYWGHNDAFPHFYGLTEDDLIEIEDTVGFILMDVATSPTSATTHFTLDQLQLIQSTVREHKQRPPELRKRYVGERRTIYGVLHRIYKEHFFNLHGEKGARLDSKQSIHHFPRKAGVDAQLPWYRRLLSALSTKASTAAVDEPEGQDVENLYSSSLWITILSYVMFGGPLVHAGKLREITLDMIVNQHMLAKYSQKMEGEWRDVTLYGTVLLGANVAFLAIQSIDEKSAPGRMTDEQRASYFSVLNSLGAIVSSLTLLILVRHREVMGTELIGKRCMSRLGLEILAVMYGMPYSLVIWALLGFFVSFVILWIRSGDFVVIGLLLVCVASFSLFLVWAVSASWEMDPYVAAATRVSETWLKVTRTMSTLLMPKRKRSPSSQLEAAERGDPLPEGVGSAPAARSSGSFELKNREGKRCSAEAMV